MDTYKLEEVKSLIEKNLLSPEVLKNILKSSTRRIENYNDEEALKILKYLSINDMIPTETKDEINKYLSEYNTYHIDEVERDNELSKNKNNRVVVIYVIIILLIIAVIVTLLRSR